MIRFPNAKINIGLSVVEKRPDGYHNIETVFYPLAVEDALEIVPSPDNHTELHLSSNQNFSHSQDNLVIKAYQLLSQHFQLPPLHFYLHKVIPSEAGLGGGSSDAACTLKMLDEMFKLALSKRQLHDFAEKLGADCPFFIENTPVFATGKGNVFQNIELDLSPYKMLLIKPSCSVSTQEAYNNIVPKKANCLLSEAVKQPVSEWKNLIFNDFEPFAFKKHPEIQHIKETLYEKGALYASMSGSGSAVYGIFDQLPQISFSTNYITFQM
jgi:4-diphosphocytidyl-2-C-methyl-D-erythritol kinase